MNEQDEKKLPAGLTTGSSRELRHTAASCNASSDELIDETGQGNNDLQSYKPFSPDIPSSEQSETDQSDEPKASFGIIAIFDALGVSSQSREESLSFFGKFKKLITGAEKEAQTALADSRVLMHDIEPNCALDQSRLLDEFCSNSENDKVFHDYIVEIKRGRKQRSLIWTLRSKPDYGEELSSTIKKRIGRLEHLRADEANEHKNYTVDAMSIYSVAYNKAVEPKFVSFGDTLILFFHHPLESEILELAKFDQSIFRDARISPVLYINSFPLFLRKMILLGMKNHIALRGAVSAGAFFRHEQHILGPAVSDAAQWHEAAEWIGLMATPFLGRHIDWCKRAFFSQQEDEAEFRKFFIEHDVPLKGSGSKRMWCVSWPYEDLKDKPPEAAKKVLFFRLGFHSSPRGTEDKYSNTVAFFDEYVRQRQPEFKDKSSQETNPGDANPESQESRDDA